MVAATHPAHLPGTGSEFLIDQQRWDTLSRFVRLSEEDRQILRKLAPLVEEYADRIVDAFYENVIRFPELERIIQRTGITLAQLKSTQRSYLLRVFSGDYGANYMADRLRIGVTHNRINLTPDWYLGAYSVYRSLLTPLIVRHFQDKPKKLALALSAVDKVFSLDAQLAMGTYIQALSQDIRSLGTSKAEIEARVGEYGRFIHRVSEGDLSQRLTITGDDDLARLGRNLNDMVEKLAQISIRLGTANGALQGVLSDTRQAVNSQRSGASQQAAAVTETTSSLEEIRATSTQTLEKAKRLAQAADQTRMDGDKGLRMVEQSVQEMQSIRSKVEAIAQTILALSKQTQQIGEITQVVANIAQHSKMLALNASIEAAKAGAAGKGFAVVAAEVKDLAEQSQESTTQVQKILQDIQHATDKAVMVTEEGAKGVDQGVDLMERTGTVVGALREVIHETSLAGQQIVAAVRQESVGIDQVASAMTEINQVTGRFVGSTEQAMKIIDELGRLGRDLEATVALFKV
ncbi:MAG: protoglobin domain-containing protein [Magnetococcus sp. WYHC-3]